MFVFSFQCVLCQFHQFQKLYLLLNVQQLFSKFTLYKCWRLVLCPPYSACSQWLASQSFTHPSYFVEICTRIKRIEYQAVRSQITMCSWEWQRREVRELCQHTGGPLFFLFSLTNFKSWTCFWEGKSGTVSVHWHCVSTLVPPVYPFSLNDTHSRTYWISVNRGCGVWSIKSLNLHRYLSMHYNQETSHIFAYELITSKPSSTTCILLNVGLPNGKCVETHSIRNAPFHKLPLLQRDRGVKRHSNFLSPPAPLFPLT